MPIVFRPFGTRDALVDTLADEIAGLLAQAVAARGEALLLATGGVTPIPLYQALSTRPLPWDKVTVLPSDARWLADDQDGSNDGMIRRTLLQGPAAAARFLPLFGPEPTPEAALPRLRAMIDPLPPADVNLLGMGEDGHTASFFKGSGELAGAIDPLTAETIVAVHAAGGAMTPHRLTLTLPTLLRARAIKVMFFGAAKRALFEEALKPGPAEALPIRTLIRQDAKPVEVFWAP